jgi:FkbM family methyltransferase
MFNIIRYFKGYVYNRVKKEGKVILRKDTVEWVLQKLLNRKIDIYEFANDTILNDYRLELIEPNDVVLDIGAGAGLYSMLASNTAKKVYTIEPVIPDILKENIKDNDKIEILSSAFGGKERLYCEYWGMRIYIKAINLNYILNHIDKNITVIKCDCEGCEWEGFLSCRDFKNIRLIDLEYHLKENDRPLKELIALLESNGFNVSIRNREKIGMLYGEK